MNSGNKVSVGAGIGVAVFFVLIFGFALGQESGIRLERERCKQEQVEQVERESPCPTLGLKFL
ncbi:MAG: hypothetical protein Q7S16_02450 [bacterium]|nr:hypothetical protein [bacterium]